MDIVMVLEKTSSPFASKSMIQKYNSPSSISHSTWKFEWNTTIACSYEIPHLVYKGTSFPPTQSEEDKENELHSSTKDIPSS